MIFQRKQESELERKLRRGRPEPEEGLLDEIVSRIAADRPAFRPRSLRIGVAAATVGMIAALAAFGGVTYAASSVQHAAVAVKHVFVAKKVQRAAKPSPSVDVLGALQPGRTSAADQYLPPGVTPVAAATAFEQYLIQANQNLQAALNCAGKTGRVRTACLRRVVALKALEARNRAALNAAIARIGTLTGAALAQVSTLLAIHINQQQKLAAAQATRRTNCASASFKSAHKLMCAKANPLVEASEQLRLGELQLAELNALLAALGP
jgi:hypothetical protein